MTNRNARPREDPSREAGRNSVLQAADKATVIMARPGDGFRARRIRRFARLELDELVNADMLPCCPCCARSTSDRSLVDDVFVDGRLGVPEREARGRELALAGWMP